jgi:hypothetical protein
MIVVPFIPAHLIGFECIDEQKDTQSFFNKEYGDYLCMGYAYSFLHDGAVIAMAGLLDQGGNRFIAWALMSQKTNKFMPIITRLIKGFLNKFNDKRIETIVLKDFVKGHRWATMLGFSNETPNGMANYYLDKNYCLYSRVKHG